ncbi:MAG: FGGY-family carbohydrate kinase, partial [Acidimicrobiales bacterium]
EGVFMVPAFAGLGSPWWDPHARGVLVGLSRGVGRAHLARAAVEAMVHQTRDVIDAMAAASGHVPSELRVDGGAAVMDLLLQLQADQLRLRVCRPSITETTAMGAIYLAGLAEGVWGSLEEISGQWALESAFEPSGTPEEAQNSHEGWHRALERSRTWAD